MKLYRYKVVFVEFVQRGFFLNFQNFMKGGIQMKSKMNKRISCVVLLAMLVQLMSFGGVLTASAEVSVADNGADYFALAKAYGVYTEAGGNPDGTDIIDGIHIFTRSSANKLVSVDDAQTLAAIDAELFSDKSATVDENGVITPGNMTELAYYAKANGVKYVGPSSDGSYDNVVAVDNTDIARDAWFTSNYWRIPNLWSIKPISSSTDENGELHLDGICLVAGLGGKEMRDGTYEYYMSEPIVKDDAKGVGPFLLAYTEMRRAGLLDV